MIALERVSALVLDRRLRRDCHDACLHSPRRRLGLSVGIGARSRLAVLLFLLRKY